MTLLDEMTDIAQRSGFGASEEPEQQTIIDEMTGIAQRSGFVPPEPERIGFKESVREEFARPAKGAQYVPIIGGVIGAAENLMYLDTAKRLREGFDYREPTQRGQFLPGAAGMSPDIYSTREQDQKLIDDLFIRLERQQAGYTFGGKVAKGLLNLPTWMAEFALTGGLAQLGSSTAKKAGERLIGNWAKTKAGQTALRAAGWTGGAITRATLGLAPRVAEKAAQRQVGVQILGTAQEGWATSFAKGWGDIVIESASEEAGGFLTKAPKAGLIKVLNKSKLGTAFLNGLQKGWSKLTGGTAAQFFKRMATKGGYSNLIGEYGEERVGTLLRAITDVEDFGAGKDATITERLIAGLKEDAKNTGVELTVLSAIPAGRVALGMAGKTTYSRKDFKELFGIERSTAAERQAKFDEDQKGVTDAERIRAETEAAGEQARAEAGREAVEGLRVRDIEKDRLEAEAREVGELEAEIGAEIDVLEAAEKPVEAPPEPPPAAPVAKVKKKGIRVPPKAKEAVEEVPKPKIGRKAVKKAKITPQPEIAETVRREKAEILPRKDEILAELDAAIKKAPKESSLRKQVEKKYPPISSEVEDYWEKSSERSTKIREDLKKLKTKLHFEIDGGINVFNTKEALQFVRKNVQALPKKEGAVGKAPRGLRTIATKGKPVAAKKEALGELVYTEDKTIFSDGRLIIKGKALAKAKFQEEGRYTEEKPLPKKTSDEILNTPTEPAEFSHFAIKDPEAGEGVSPQPVPDISPTGEGRAVAIFKTRGKFVHYEQKRFNVIRNRFPDAEFGVGDSGLLIAKIGGKPVAALMPIDVDIKGERGAFSSQPIVEYEPEPLKEKIKGRKKKPTFEEEPIDIGEQDKASYDVWSEDAPPPPEEGQSHREGPNEPERGIFTMVDLVELAKALNEGKYPYVAKRLAALKGRAGGVFQSEQEKIGLKADIFIGPIIIEEQTKTGRAEDVAARLKFQILQQTYLQEKDIEIRIASTKKAGWSRVTLYRIDPNYAPKILAHEIGHLVDWLPDKELGKGNILGRIASLKNFAKKQLAGFKGGLGEVTAKEKAKLRRQAEKMMGVAYEIEVDEEIRKVTDISPEDILAIWNSTMDMRKVAPELYEFIARMNTAAKKAVVLEAMKGNVAETLLQFGHVEVIKTGRKIKKTIEPDLSSEAIKKKYRELFEEEIRKRKLVEFETVEKELKELSKWWKPFNPRENLAYTNYRFQDAELYADALSVLLNNPAALQKQAPTFYRAFFGWLENKPDVEENYYKILDDIKSGSSLKKADKRMRAAARKGDKKAFSKYTKIRGGITAVQKALRVAFVDKFAITKGEARKAKRAGKITEAEDPTASLEKAVYGQNDTELYYIKVNREVTSMLEEGNLSMDDLNMYMFYQRVINERGKFANPEGFTPTTAKQQITDMKAELGPRRYAALEQARENLWNIRKEMVIAKAKQAGVYGKELMDYIENNEFYATFEVLKYIDTKYGKGVGPKIHAQIGTVESIRGAADATIEKDISLMSSINWNTAKRSVVDFLLKEAPNEIEMAEKRWVTNHYEFKNPKDPSKGMLMFLHHGELQAYYVDKWHLYGLNRENSKIVEVGSQIARSIGAPFRLLFVGVNVGFQAFNIQRDFRRALRNLPEAGLKKFTTYYTKAVLPAFASTFGKPTPAIEELLKAQALISVADVGGLTSEQRTLQRLKSMYSGTPKYKAKFVNPLWYFHNFLRVGEAIERIPKIAGWEYIKKELPDMTEAEAGHLIRTQVGSPAFLTKGTMTWLTNNLWLFSNPAVQGWRSDLKAYKDRPGDTLRKLAAYTLLPKAIMWTLGSGAMVALLKAMGGDDDDDIVKWANSVEKVYGNISEYDMTNYICIPLGITEQGKTVMLRLPTDENERFFGGLMWKLMNSHKAGLKSFPNVLEYGAGQLPGLNPAIGVSTAVFQYMTGRNPYDNFRGRHVIPETLWKAGGKESNIAFMKHLSNEVGGGIVHRFTNSDIEGVRTEYEKIINAPVIGNITNRFIKITDKGRSELFAEVKEAEQKKRAKVIQELKTIANKQYAGELLTTKEVALVKEEKTYLKKRGRKVSTIKKGDRYAKELMFAQTRAEKDAIHLKILEIEGKDFDLAPYIEKDITMKARVFGKRPPVRIAERRKWRSDIEEAIVWLKERNIDRNTVINLYRTYLRENIEKRETRTGKLRQLKRKLKIGDLNK